MGEPLPFLQVIDIILIMNHSFKQRATENSGNFFSTAVRLQQRYDRQHFYKENMKTPISDEKNMVNMKFDEHKYVSKVPQVQVTILI